MPSRPNWAQHLRDPAWLRRVRDQIARDYAHPLDVEALRGGTGEAEVALIYQAEGSDCPVIWGLGPTDALNGEDAAIQLTRADGTAACVDADGSGGIEVTNATAEGCAA